jgi:endonuclease/exonuclease/phosphatase family metal-dependent hydrolase
MTGSPADPEHTTTVVFSNEPPRRARSLTRRVARWFAMFVLILILVVVAFFFWASGGDSDDREVAPGRVLDRSAQVAVKAFPPAGTNPPGALTVVSFNIGYGRGPAGDESGPWTREHIEKHLYGIAGQLVALNADLVFLQEVDLDSARSHHIDQGVYLADKAAFPFVSCVTTWEKNYVPFPYWPPSRHYGAMKSGQCVLSRFPIKSSTRHRLPQPTSNPWWRNRFYLNRALDVLELDLGGRRVHAVNVHLEAFDVDNRMDQVQRLIALMPTLEADRLVVAGDFNALPPDAAQKKGFVDEPEADFTNDATLTMMRKVEGLSEAVPEHTAFTFPADGPTRRLDYVFFGRAFQRLEGRVVSEAPVWSDHLPVLVKLSLN